jgi:ABC-type ATPase with predicted acetyltransferase domain
MLEGQKDGQTSRNKQIGPASNRRVGIGHTAIRHDLNLIQARRVPESKARNADYETSVTGDTATARRGLNGLPNEEI